MIDGSSQVRKGKTLQAMMAASGRTNQAKALQRMANPGAAAQNNTGLPDQLKSGIERLSGMSMDHVKVNYNSARPAQLNAHAFAQGSEIHVAPGQERHVPHEAWHVVQQAQGRVKPTVQMKTGVPVNDDAALESEADVMGANAQRTGTVQRKGRVEWSALEGHKDKDAIKEKVDAARLARITAKDAARNAWLPENGAVNGKYAVKDDAFNIAMEAARKQYGLDMLTIKEKYALNDKQFVTGKKYYGTETDGIWKRPDGKQYVEDSNGIFTSRFVRRELNKHDLHQIERGQPLTSRGASKHVKGVKGKKASVDRPKVKEVKGYGDPNKAGTDFDFDEREFLQQSSGGGKNQFALSHTATRHPILSNDHKNFGKRGPKDKLTDRHGRIVMDLSKIGKAERRAQWSLAPEEEGGHKIRRAHGFGDEWMRKRRNKVTSSGYRNMEVVTKDVPVASVAAKQIGWEGDDALGANVSPAGQWFEGHRNPK
jgi:hypothetical protein